MTRPLTLEELELLPPAAFAWPVTYHWVMAAPWGTTALDMSVDVPELADNGAATERLGYLLWQAVVAPATTFLLELQQQWVATWKVIGVPVPGFPPTPLRGANFFLGTPREDSVQLILFGQHEKGYHRRRWTWPAAPRPWVEHRQLTTAGWEGSMTVARGLLMGIGRQLGYGRMSWLMEHIGAVAPDAGNIYGVGFAPVTHLRVCDHTGPAPEVTSAIWP